MQNRAGFERALGKAKRESSMAVNSTDANNETNDAHFLNILLNLVNSIRPMTKARKQASPIKTFIPNSLRETAKNIPQVIQTRQT